MAQSSVQSSSSCRSIKIYVMSGISTCWPHFRRKISQGEYLSKEHAFYPQLCQCVYSIHIAQTENMHDMLLEQAGKLIDPVMKRNPKLLTLWNEYCVEPWACWSLANNGNVPLTIANNQPIEAWHRKVMRTLKYALKGRTAAVLEHSFPKIVQSDSKPCKTV